jgi:uncharacterized protein with transglutaminase domain
VTLGLAAVVTAARTSGLPTSAFLDEHVALTGMAPDVEHTLGDVVFVPIGALVVVTFRLVLGIRVLGPFRSVLLAFAFVATGIWTGLLFLALTIALLLGIRPLVRSLRLPYYGRISVMLSAVAVLIVAGALVGRALGDHAVADVAHFPIVVLCLVGEAVAREMRREGVASGLWRATATAAAAVVVALLASIAPLRDVLLRRPELLFVEIALIIVVARHGAYRLLAPPDRAAAAEPPTTRRAVLS